MGKVDNARNPGITAAKALEQRLEGYFAAEYLRPVVVGKTPGANAVELRTNDYLALAGHPDILAAQTASIRDQGHGLMMSGVYADGATHLRVFEKRLGDFMGAEDSLLCQSGYAANAGLLQAISIPDMPVYIDFRAHMSIWEGAKSGKGVPRAFRHNDVEHLERLLKETGPGTIVVDSVYSTIGTEAPLIDIVDLSERYGCILVVDESHTLGTHGPSGAGLVAELGLSDRVPFRTASLAKTFAGRGGVVVSSARHTEFLRFASLHAIFSSAILPHEIVAFEATLDVIASDDARRDALWTKTDFLRRELTALGYPIAAPDSQIIALEAGPEARTVKLRDALEAHDVYGAVFCAPATPKKRSLLRLSVNSGLSREQLDKVVSACAAIRDDMELNAWPGAKRARSTNTSKRKASAKRVSA